MILEVGLLKELLPPSLGKAQIQFRLWQRHRFCFTISILTEGQIQSQLLGSFGLMTFDLRLITYRITLTGVGKS